MHNCLIAGGICEFSTNKQRLRLISVVEIIGYGARAAAHFETTSTICYAVQSLFLLLAPILLAASVYMYLGHLIRLSRREDLAIMPTRWITKAFVLGDVTCFLIQAAGGGILSAAKSQSTVDIGNYVILAGLVLQIMFFAWFVVVATLFHARFVGVSKDASDNSILRQLGLLYVASALITGRNVYRVLEYALGQDGYLLKHEWSLYVFDGGFMVVVLMSCLAWYWSGIERSVAEERVVEEKC